MSEHTRPAEAVEKDDLPSSAEVAAEIAAIDREIADHETGIVAFEEANLAGDDVDFDELPRRRTAIDILRARRQGAKARRAKAAQRERLAVLTQLRDRILSEETGDSDQLISAAKTFHKAGVELLAVAKARQERHAAITKELRTHNVPQRHILAPTPAPEHAGLGFSNEGIAVGLQRLRKIDGPDALATLADAVLETAANGGTHAFDKLVARLEGLDREVDWQPDRQSYWQGSGGSVITYGLDGPDELTRRGMRQVTEKEALQIWWSDTAMTTG